LKFRITILSENTVSPGRKGLIGEHGLSILVESADQTILFDTGQGGALVPNAREMGIDLTVVDTVVLSHGHYDHAGGLRSLVEVNSRFTLIAHPDVFNDKIARRDDGQYPIGMPVGRDFLEQAGVCLKLQKTPVTICRWATTTGEIPMETDFEAMEPYFFQRRGGRMVPDPLADDQSLVLRSDEGVVVLLGCSHRGVINTLKTVAKLSEGEPVAAIFGGLHLESASDEKLARICRYLKDFNIGAINAGHCTGMRAFLALSNAFPGRVFLNAVGRTATFRFSGH